MRYALYFALLAGCSYEHGILPGPGGEHDAAIVPEDASPSIDGMPDPDSSGVTVDAAVDAPIDAHTCPPDFTTLPGGQPTSRYKRYGFSQSMVNVVTFAQASAICTSAGGYLAIPNDESELDALEDIQQQQNHPGYWVGITDEDVEGLWRTVLGDLAIYLPWSSSQGQQPNGGLSANCVVGYDEELYDVECDLRYVFSCECTL